VQELIKVKENPTQGKKKKKKGEEKEEAST
jgi:hypothetical protein